MFQKLYHWENFWVQVYSIINYSSTNVLNCTIEDDVTKDWLTIWLILQELFLATKKAPPRWFDRRSLYESHSSCLSFSSKLSPLIILGNYQQRRAVGRVGRELLGSQWGKLYNLNETTKSYWDTWSPVDGINLYFCFQILINQGEMSTRKIHYSRMIRAVLSPTWTISGDILWDWWSSIPVILETIYFRLNSSDLLRSPAVRHLWYCNQQTYNEELSASPHR